MGQQFEELKHLNLNNNKIEDISSLSELKGLLYLRLCNNKIKDVTPLKKLTKLNSLELSNNEIETISGFEDCFWLSKIDISNNSIKDISLLKHNSKNKDFEYFADNQKIYISNFENNKIRNISYRSIKIENLNKINSLDNVKENEIVLATFGKANSRFNGKVILSINQE